MHREVTFDLMDQFVREMKRLGITKLAFCETRERRAVQEGTDVLSVLPVVKLELLAYLDSILYKCVLNDVDLNASYERLAGEGFEVNRSSRNIT